MQRDNITVAEATKRVEDTNKRREQYVKRYGHRDWLAPENYHLCLNTEWLGIDGSAALIIQVVRQRLL
jgi:cytidylate kinase